MAYVQDISLMMKELLKVPRDYTPTVVEIAKYIKARYKTQMGDKADGGARGMATSSTAKTVEVPRTNKLQTRRSREKPIRTGKKSLQPRVHQRRRLSTVTNHLPKKMRTWSLRGQTDNHMPPEPHNKWPITSESPTSYQKLMAIQNLQTKQTNQMANRANQVAKKPNQIPKKPTQVTNDNIVEPNPQAAAPPTTWKWQAAANQVRRAMSGIGVAATKLKPKSRLSQMSHETKTNAAEQQIQLKNRQKEKLNKMVSNSVESEPIRTREIIQRLLEDNKLEAQKQEIAELMNLARTEIAKAKKSCRTGGKKSRTKLV